jgi:hypothetical protein
VVESITLRFAFPDDQLAVNRLAALDSSRPPAPPVLIAEVAGELRAALSITDGTAVADPFHLTTEHVALLRIRAARLTGAEGEGADVGRRRVRSVTLRSRARALVAGWRFAR